jgi:two-component system CheB/CheR fusion protein
MKATSRNTRRTGKFSETKKQKKAPGPGKKKDVFRIVGIGASAGGLEALEQFFSVLPPDTGMAFIVVQHLDPTHKGILPELLQRLTRMKVTQARDRIRARPDEVYVIPPNRDLSILRGKLQLLDPLSPRGHRLPIDFFFRHLADDQQGRSIGIILSGMGTDGSLGLKAIKEKNGIVMVQDPATAKFDSMPRSAISACVTDYVGPAEGLAEKLVAFAGHIPLPTPAKLMQESKSSNGLDKILVLLRARTGQDFSLYKKNTLYRRIERRMGIHQIDKIMTYVRFLQENPQELDLLFKELLIGVTSFFRDHEAFETLKTKAIPALFKSKKKYETIRVWVPGCSTGEEAYSIAMVLCEALDEIKKKTGLKILIFATDLDKDAIDKGRQGVYPGNITADVSQERLKRFFTKEDNTYRVNRAIREMVIFAPQNVLTDPPFTKLNILICRNLLIYLSAESQKKLIPLFFYALVPQGILFLGSSETIGSFSELFSTFNGKWKIYQRKELSVRAISLIDFPTSFVPAGIEAPGHMGNIHTSAVDSIQVMADNLLLKSFSPPAVLINSKGDILYINGRTGMYLEPAAGKAAMNVYAMAREGLRYELSISVRKAIKDKKEVIRRGLKVKTDGDFRYIDLTVTPISQPDALQGLLMVLFREVAGAGKQSDRERKTVPSRVNQERIITLEAEIQSLREYLQGVIEEMQASQEALISTNEELQSTNEELQSTNEELTTSKEEMQSLNEELMSVNAELQMKNDELTTNSNDMKNLLDSTDIATLFLDRDLNVRRFTPQATRIFKLLPGDRGRSITDIVTDLQYPGLVGDIRGVLETLVLKNIQVPTNDGRWYMVRIMPYRTFDNILDGVVITFSDLILTNPLEASLRQSESRFTGIVETASEGIMIIDRSGMITYANASAGRLLGMPRAAVMGRMYNDRAWKVTSLDMVMYPGDGFPVGRTAKSGKEEKNIAIAIEHQDGSRVIATLDVAPLMNPAGEITSLAVTMIERKDRWDG